MAENPLLPHADLRALHRLLRMALADASLSPARRLPSAGLPGRDKAALLAATLLQLRAEDIAVEWPEPSTPKGPRRKLPASTAAPGLTVAGLLRQKSEPLPSCVELPGNGPRLHLAAGLAAGLRRAGSEAAVLVFVEAGRPEPGWKEALAWVQEDRLPLLLAVADPSGADIFRTDVDADAGIFAWPAVSRAAAKLQLPILSADGEDAVALYRVTQESLLRGRLGGGPAVLWAALPSSASPRRPSRQPALALTRLEAFLTARGISVP